MRLRDAHAARSIWRNGLAGLTTVTSEGCRLYLIPCQDALRVMATPSTLHTRRNSVTKLLK